MWHEQRWTKAGYVSIQASEGGQVLAFPGAPEVAAPSVVAWKPGGQLVVLIAVYHSGTESGTEVDTRKLAEFSVEIIEELWWENPEVMLASPERKRSKK